MSTNAIRRRNALLQRNGFLTRLEPVYQRFDVSRTAEAPGIFTTLDEFYFTTAEKFFFCTLLGVVPNFIFYLDSGKLKNFQ